MGEGECVRSGGGKERNGGAAWKKWCWMEVNSVKGCRVLAGISKKGYTTKKTLYRGTVCSTRFF